MVNVVVVSDKDFEPLRLVDVAESYKLHDDRKKEVLKDSKSEFGMVITPDHVSTRSHTPQEDDFQQRFCSLEFSNFLFDKLLSSVIDHEYIENIISTLLIRQNDENDSLFVYHDPTIQQKQRRPNIRATRLAISCGHFSIRLYGTVVLIRMDCSTNTIKPLEISDIFLACCISPDFRDSTIHTLAKLLSSNEITSSHTTKTVPDWISNACKANYLDGSVLRRLFNVMNNGKIDCLENSSDHDSCSGTTSTNSRSDEEGGGTFINPTFVEDLEKQREFVTKVSLCLHCRKPASTLCRKCSGAYFCDPPASCEVDCWSHQCLCLTWKLYVDQREIMSSFPGLGSWCIELVTRPYQLSEAVFDEFLECHLVTSQNSIGPWWQTEFSGGWFQNNKIATNNTQEVDVTVRRTYSEGFAPLTDYDIPMEEPIDDKCRDNNFVRNQVGFPRLQSWDDYYKLRSINKTSIAALVLTYPLTLYYAIEQYGEVACTVASMLRRKLRIHIVGSEKEINFLDVFNEVLYLMGTDNNCLPYGIEIVFIVRDYRVPQQSTDILNENNDTHTTGTSTSKEYTIDLQNRLQVRLISGTYGDNTSIDPNFDCGTGPPDMIVAFNAGLYAYDTWRNVVLYLDQNPNVVGIFTDYNEFSGIQCAALGGTKARQSLCINPFRQPRAMPVYSMNLPQFSNGFLYVFNQQVLD